MDLSRMLFAVALTATPTLAAPSVPNNFFPILSYSPYRDGQGPGFGELPTKDQIREDIRIIKKITPEIRLYATGECGETILQVCAEENVGVHVGAWLGPEFDPSTGEPNFVGIAANRLELDRLISQANNPVYKSSIRSLIVGNETILRNDVTEDQLVDYIKEVRAKTSNLPVTSGQIAWHYINNWKVAVNVDFILFHVHPYWEGIPGEKGAQAVERDWMLLSNMWPSKRVVIGETGYPTNGDPYGWGDVKLAVPSESAQAIFTYDLMNRAMNLAQSGHSMTYSFFDGFDEEWKESAEAGSNIVGGFWGLYNRDRSPKPIMNQLFSAAPAGYQAGNDPLDAPMGGYAWCAEDNGTYTFSQPVDVAYGSNGHYVFRHGVTGAVTFSADQFGDPMPGAEKAGFFRLSKPTGFTWCANQGGSFTFTSPVDLAYGTNGQYVFRYGVTGPVEFSDSNFEYTGSGAKAGFWRPASGAKMAFKASNASYLSATDDGIVAADSESIGSRQTFELKGNMDGTVSLRALQNGKYLMVPAADAADSIAPVLKAGSDSVDNDYSRFELLYNADGTVSLWSRSRNAFAVLTSGQELRADQGLLTDATKFVMIIQ